MLVITRATKRSNRLIIVLQIYTKKYNKTMMKCYIFKNIKKGYQNSNIEFKRVLHLQIKILRQFDVFWSVNMS